MDISSNELKILKSLQTNVFGTRLPSSYMTTEVIRDKTNISYEVVKYCIDRLIEKNFIEINLVDLNLSKIYSYKVTPSGNDFLDDLKSKTISKYIWSVLIPFAISIAGTLATNYFSHN